MGELVAERVRKTEGRISANGCFQPRGLRATPVLAGFQAMHPEVELEPTLAPTASLWTLFDSHDVDVAIGGCPQ